MSKKKDQCFFSNDWLTDPEFKYWLCAVKNNNKEARCKLRSILNCCVLLKYSTVCSIYRKDIYFI